MKKIRKQDYFELAIFLAHYHTGMWSRGCRLLCKLNPHYSSEAEHKAMETDIYQYLVEHYKDKI